MAHNPHLAEKQGLNEIETETIDKLHLLRAFLEREASDATNSKEHIQQIYNIWFQNEILLQKIWKFNDVSFKFVKFGTFLDVLVLSTKTMLFIPMKYIT